MGIGSDLVLKTIKIIVGHARPGHIDEASEHCDIVTFSFCYQGAWRLDTHVNMLRAKTSWEKTFSTSNTSKTRSLSCPPGVWGFFDEGYSWCAWCRSLSRIAQSTRPGGYMIEFRILASKLFRIAINFKQGRRVSVHLFSISLSLQNPKISPNSYHLSILTPLSTVSHGL